MAGTIKGTSENSAKIKYGMIGGALMHFLDQYTEKQLLWMER